VCGGEPPAGRLEAPGRQGKIEFTKCRARREPTMPRDVRGGLIQATLCESVTSPIAKIKEAMIEKHVGLIAQAAGKGAEVVCMQELFYGPYFCAEQQSKWYDLTERVPDGPTVKLMCSLAKKHELVLIVPVYEEDLPGVYYNTAAVIDADGSY